MRRIPRLMLLKRRLQYPQPPTASRSLLSQLTQGGRENDRSQRAAQQRGKQLVVLFCQSLGKGGELGGGGVLAGYGTMSRALKHSWTFLQWSFSTRSGLSCSHSLPFFCWKLPTQRSCPFHHWGFLGHRREGVPLTQQQGIAKLL